MAQAAGGAQHVRQLILQAEACLATLAEECEGRGVQPERQAQSVASGEHAWEVSNSTIRRAWGLDG
jgi:S-formylglutathione hydrolase FrmB